MLANIALRWLDVRFSLRPDLPWRMASSPTSARDSGRAHSIVVFVPLGQIFDVLGRPVGDFHAEMEAHLRQDFLDLV
jgi:hypothetical protein